jgi:hypothetical protein
MCSILSEKISMCGNSGLRISISSNKEEITCSRCIKFMKTEKPMKKIQSRQGKKSKKIA